MAVDNAESRAGLARLAEEQAALPRVATLVARGVPPVERGQLRVEIRDDGIGGAQAGDSSGLRGLDDRVSALDGRLVVESVQGQGTVVSAFLPVPDRG
jgi:glucose-6-phosphate-specific signal transduction histidine kinase